MLKRSIMLFAIVLTIGSTFSSTAARNDEITLIMVPREMEPVQQLAMDLAEKFGSMVISYKVGANQAYSLHGWTGSQWVLIRPEAFKTGDFFRVGPGSALIVEEAGKMVPMSMIPPADWCPVVSKIATTEMRPLLHLTGRYYDFSYKEWKWFAKRFNMTMDDVNPEGLNVDWYHRRLGENLAARQQGAYDQQYWVSVRRPSERAAVVLPAEDDVPAAEAGADNLLTNEVPEAVIMAPGDAEESKSDTVADGDEAAAAAAEAVEEAPPADAENGKADEEAAETETEDAAAEDGEMM